MDDEFHQHLDVCKRCMNHPFNLCETGARLLEEDKKLHAGMEKKQ